MVQRAGAVRERVLDVGEDQAMRVHTPLLHRHGADHLGRKAGLGLSRLFSGQTPVRVGVLERLEPVVDLHRGLHPLDVVLVVR